MLGLVYHSDVILSGANLGSVAPVFGVDGGVYCVVNYVQPGAFGQVRPAGALVVNPAPGTIVDGRFDINQESPRVAAAQIPGDAAVAGTPILASIYNADFINARNAGTLAAVVNKFELTDSTGKVVQAVLLSSPEVSAAAGVASHQAVDSNLLPGSVFLIPTAPLAAGTYRAVFKAYIQAGVVANKEWSFTAR